MTSSHFCSSKRAIRNLFLGIQAASTAGMRPHLIVKQLPMLFRFIKNNALCTIATVVGRAADVIAGGSSKTEHHEKDRKRAVEQAHTSFGAALLPPHRPTPNLLPLLPLWLCGAGPAAWSRWGSCPLPHEARVDHFEHVPSGHL